MGLLDSIKKYKDKHLIKNEALDTFLIKGFPTTKNEEWKYTSLKKVLDLDYLIEDNSVEINDKEIEKYSLNIGSKIVFINGELWQKPEIHGVKIQVNAFDNLTFNDSATSLNAGLAKKGYLIEVEKNLQLEKPLEILLLNKNKSNSFVQYRNKVLLNENAKIKIVENIRNLNNEICFTNYVTEIDLKKNANLEFNKLQDYNESQNIIDTTNITQAEQSISTINTLLFGGSFTRNNLNFIQNGAHCESNMNGIIILNNNEIGDNHTYVDHKRENCQSNELYKGIYLGKSKGVFNGKIMVRPDAQKINAFQANNNLLLSENSAINSKPQLEIYADDVKCSHGCTIGQLDEKALFYLRTRGISKKDAMAILTFAFASEAMEKISIPELALIIKNLMQERLNVKLSI
ncbi:Fe-S cluster assembly protein SufD [bacterium]|nr:Fe-S cluster assembly protein SufD [bacterium]